MGFPGEGRPTVCSSSNPPARRASIDAPIRHGTSRGAKRIAPNRPRMRASGRSRPLIFPANIGGSGGKPHVLHTVCPEHGFFGTESGDSSPSCRGRCEGCSEGRPEAGAWRSIILDRCFPISIDFTPRPPHLRAWWGRLDQSGRFSADSWAPGIDPFGSQVDMCVTCSSGSHCALVCRARRSVGEEVDHDGTRSGYRDAQS